MAVSFRVRKRDGSIERFSREKLRRSVRKAFSKSFVADGRTADRITNQAVALLRKKYKKVRQVPVEHIKETTKSVLMKNKFKKVAKHYALYRYL